MDTLSCRDFSAWITVGEETLPVYQEETVGTTCSAWIPSTAGHTFSVWWKDNSKACIATSGHVSMDGRDVASAIMRPGRSKPVERSGAKISSRTLKPFTFSVLRLTGTHDDSIANVNNPNLQDMGTIKIEISRVKLGGEVPFKGYDARNQAMVHEKAKKLGAHCTAYGPSKRSTASRTVAVTTAPYYEGDPGPYVTFIFRYRSEDLLRANGIIGAPDKRDSPHVDNEVIEISDSEDDIRDRRFKEGSPTKKRARIEANEDEVSQVRRPPQSKDTDGGNDIEPDVDGSTHIEDVGIRGSQLDSGTSSLLRQEAQQEESQTQMDDDTQLDFGTPSLLQHQYEVPEEQTEGEAQNEIDLPTRGAGILLPDDETQNSASNAVDSLSMQPSSAVASSGVEEEVSWG